MAGDVEESDPRFSCRVKIIDTVLDHRPIAPVTRFQRAYEFDLFATGSWNAPQSRSVIAFCIVQESSVGRFERCKSTVTCHLYCGPTCRRHLPYLPTTSVIRCVIYPVAIATNLVPLRSKVHW